MREEWIKSLKILILLLMAGFFAATYLSGKLALYISPRFAWQLLIAIPLLAAIAAGYVISGRRTDDGDYNHSHIHDEHCYHDQHHAHGARSLWPLGLIAFPLLLGILIPARPLGASAASTRGVSFSAPPPSAQASRLAIVPSERNILDWVRVIGGSPDPAVLGGQEARVIGFVYRDSRFADNQFMVSRFIIAHCAADGQAIGLIVQAENAADFESDSWVEIHGAFSLESLGDEAMPVLIAEHIQSVDQPNQPYLYQ